MTLALRGYVNLPTHAAGGFDHGDVHPASGRVFVAHTANGTVEVIDGLRGTHERTLGGCPEGSGVLCVQSDDAAFVFAAARGAGKVLVLDPVSCELRREIAVGPKPNGLAWDPGRKQLLVADVQDFRARLVDPSTAQTVAEVELPGRPRWCVYEARRNRFVVNIRDPACVVGLGGGTAAEVARFDVGSVGPHGLDLDVAGGRAFVACDAGEVVVLDLETGKELARVRIASEPDVAWYSPDRDRLYVAVGKPGEVDVVDCRTMSVADQIPTEESAHTTAYDRRRHRLYVFLPQTSRAAIFEEINRA